LVVAGLIQRGEGQRFGNISYFLAVCQRKRKGNAVVMRKFHFDVCDGAARRRQEQPVSHFQYCGSFHQYLADIGCTERQFEQMYHWLSEPRILYWPMSLALLV